MRHSAACGLAVALCAGGANAGFMEEGELMHAVRETSVAASNPADPVTGSTFNNPEFWDLWVFKVFVPQDAAVIIDIDRLVEDFDSVAAVYTGDARGLSIPAGTALDQVPGLALLEFRDDDQNFPFEQIPGGGSPLFFGDPFFELDVSTLGSPTYYSVFIANNGGAFRAEGYSYEIEVTIPSPGSSVLLGLAGLAIAKRKR